MIFAAEHAAYVSALREAGCSVTLLEADENFPDSVFVEDPALVLKGIAIVLRPGAPTRLGEAAALRPALESAMNDVVDLPGPGYIDGGDILCTDDRVLVGLSARTDETGAEALRSIVADLGYGLEIVKTPPEILHFKTETSLLDESRILATPRIKRSGALLGFDLIETAPGEEAAANAIRVNSSVFLSAGYPRTADKLDQAGFNVKILNTSQAALVDGGLSCMSLRYSL